MSDFILLRIYRYFRISSKTKLKNRDQTASIYGFDIAVQRVSYKKEKLNGQQHEFNDSNMMNLPNKEKTFFISDIRYSPTTRKSSNRQNIQNESEIYDEPEERKKSIIKNTQIGPHFDKTMIETILTPRDYREHLPITTLSDKNTNQSDDIFLYRLSTIATTHLLKGSHTLQEIVSLSDGSDGVLLLPGLLTDKFLIQSANSKHTTYDRPCTESIIDQCYLPFLTDVPTICLKKNMKMVRRTIKGYQLSEIEKYCKNETSIVTEQSNINQQNIMNQENRGGIQSGEDACSSVNQCVNQEKITNHSILAGPSNRNSTIQSFENFIQAKIILKSRIMTYRHGKRPYYRVFLCKKESEAYEKVNSEVSQKNMVKEEGMNKIDNDKTKNELGNTSMNKTKTNKAIITRKLSYPSEKNTSSNINGSHGPFFILTLWNSQIFYDLTLNISIIFIPIERKKFSPAHSVINSYADTKGIQREIKVKGDIFKVLEMTSSRAAKMENSNIVSSETFQMKSSAKIVSNKIEEKDVQMTPCDTNNANPSVCKEQGIKLANNNLEPVEHPHSETKNIDFPQDDRIQMINSQEITTVETNLENILRAISYPSLLFPHFIQGLIIDLSPMFKYRRNTPKHLLDPSNVTDQILDFYFIRIFGIVWDGHQNKVESSDSYCINCSKTDHADIGCNKQSDVQECNICVFNSDSQKFSHSNKHSYTGNCNHQCSKINRKGNEYNENVKEQDFEEICIHNKKYCPVYLNILLFDDGSHLFYDLKAGMRVKITNLYKIGHFYTNSIFTMVSRECTINKTGALSVAQKLKDKNKIITQSRFTLLLENESSVDLTNLKNTAEPGNPPTTFNVSRKSPVEVPGNSFREIDSMKMPNVCTTGTLTLFDIHISLPSTPIIYQHHVVDYGTLSKLKDALLVSEGIIILLQGRIVEKREEVTIECEYVKIKKSVSTQNERINSKSSESANVNAIKEDKPKKIDNSRNRDSILVNRKEVTDGRNRNSVLVNEECVTREVIQDCNLMKDKHDPMKGKGPLKRKKRPSEDVNGPKNRKMTPEKDENLVIEGGWHQNVIDSSKNREKTIEERDGSRKNQTPLLNMKDHHINDIEPLERENSNANIPLKYLQRGHVFTLMNSDKQTIDIVAFKQIDEQKEEFKIFMVRMDQYDVILIVM